MEYLNKAQQLVDEFNSLFPIVVNHSGGTHSCETFTELEEWDCAAGEMWANFMDDKGIDNNFSLDELENQGDDLLLTHYIRENLESYINGNVTEAISNFETMLQECDVEEVINCLDEQESPKNADLIIRALLIGNY